MSGAIREEPAGEAFDLARGGFKSLGGGDRAGFHFQPVNVVAEKKADVLLGAYDLFLLVIHELFRRRGRALRLVLDLADDLVEWVFARRVFALRPHADFGRAIAAEHLAVLNQCHLDAHPRCGNGDS